MTLVVGLPNPGWPTMNDGRLGAEVQSTAVASVDAIVWI